jgi:hypothetical protein
MKPDDLDLPNASQRDCAERCSTRVSRALFALIILLMLGAPTPGAVGSCGAEDGEADLFSFCREREELTCWRRGLRRELTEKAVTECRENAIEQCKQRVWAPECRPTERQAEACINALRSLDTVQTVESRIAECKEKRLCTAEAAAETSDKTDSGEEP